jgi:hypothetical protein
MNRRETIADWKCVEGRDEAEFILESRHISGKTE